MRKSIFIIAIVCLILFELSCSNNSNKVVTRSEIQPNKNDTSQSFSGIFFGITPCADCPGIETTVHFNTDSVFIENLNYMERNTSFADTGKWSISDSIITVSFPGHQAYFSIKSDSAIFILDAYKKKIEGALSDKYILKRKN